MATPNESQAAPTAQVDPFRGDEGEAIAELVRRCAASTEDAHADVAWGEAAELERELAQWDVPASETLFVAREAEKVVGLCGVECFPRDGMGLVHGPVVDPMAVADGIDRALLEVALRTAARHGTPELWAATGRDNRRTQALYVEAGFARDEACALFHLERAAHTPFPVPSDVRRASSDDLSNVLALAETLGVDLQMTLEELADALVDPAWQVWIAGMPNALSIVCIDPNDRWVRVLATHEEARRRGLGAAVLSAALEGWWSEQPETPVGLSVRADSLANLMQYRRVGFEPGLVVARYSRSASGEL